MNPILVAENVSKKYSRNANTHLSYGLRDVVRELFGKRPDLTLRKDEFLAVSDVSLHLNPGDSFALIGRNGSGKTTLLKMLCGLTKPDAGSIVVNGNIQALINLGAGFNGALTGRENVYNSAALMGLNRKQTKSILDEVIDFSQLAEFMDSPYSTYSSGMKARLGFAVAIHLNPELLLVDEILAVGDHAFQNRCFRRMQQLKKQGATIILVSHNHNSVIQLCDRALWLHQGKAKQLGDAKETVKAYLSFLEEAEAQYVAKQEAEEREKSAVAPAKTGSAADPYDGLYGPIFSEFDRIDDLEFGFRCRDAEADSLTVHDPLTLEYAFTLKESVSDLNVTLKFFRDDGLHLSTLSTLNGDLVKHITQGRVHCICDIEDFDFNPGTYALVLAVHEGRSYLYRNVVKMFSVVGGPALTWGIRDFKYRYEVVDDANSRQVRSPSK